MTAVEPQDVVDFWRESGPEAWFTKDDAFDATIRERFGATLDAASGGGLAEWAGDAEGTLALILVLDQFTRNLRRGSADAFGEDERAVALTRRAIENGWVEDLLANERTRAVAVFALMPLMHSESIVDQEECVRRMLRPDWEGNFKFAVVHRDVIERFGRFPHRNAVLGRRTTPAERAFLDGGGFGG